MKERKKIGEIIGPKNKLAIVEPFLGTGVVSGLYGEYGQCQGNDLNGDIIGLYKHCDNISFYTRAENFMQEEHANRDFFYARRAEFDKLEIGSFERAVYFFYLQNCAHFGLYRIGKSGNYTSTWHFLVPKLDFDKRYRSLLHIKQRFTYSLAQLDYKEFLTKKARWDVAHLNFVDPPYINASYDDYSVDAEAFTKDDLYFLDDYCSFLWQKHHVWSIICNYKTDNDQDIYKNASEIRSFSSMRSMNLQNAKDKNFKESIWVLYGDFTRTDNNPYL